MDVKKKGRKRLSLFLNIFWGILIVAVLLLLFKNHLPSLPGLLKKLRREPVRAVRAFKPQSMGGFRCDFSRPEDFEIWKPHSIRLKKSTSLLGGDDTWARVTYFPAGVPGLLWNDETMGVTDWRAARYFRFSVYNPQGWAVDLKVKIKDVSGNSFQKNISLPPERLTEVSIPIEQIATRLDLSRVGYLNLFLWRPATETVLYYTDLEFPTSREPLSPTALVSFMGMEFPSRIAAGTRVEAAFYFIFHRKLAENYHLLVRLERGEETYPLTEIEPPFPTSRWQPERLHKIGPFPVTIPAGFAPGLYRLEVILSRPRSDSGEGLLFQPYDNLEGYSVGEITVTADSE